MARISLVAATDPILPPGTPATNTEPGSPAPMPLAGRRFHAVIAVEDVWTGDGRFFQPGAFTWADLPLPFMADDRNHEAHDESVLIGNIDTIERIGNEIHAWGQYVDSSDDPEAARLQGRIARGELRGVSVDPDDPVWETIIPAEMLAEPVEDEDGDLHVAGAYPKDVYSSIRIRGATVLPFPAIEQTYVEDDPGEAEIVEAVAASADATGVLFAHVDPRTDVLVASAAAHPWIKPPVVPPASFFDDLELDGPTPMTVTDDGEYYGHLALWGQCHIGRYGECITPPASNNGYADFHLGEIVCDDGTRVAVGKLTIDAPHADLRLPAAAATAHYDHTGTEVAHIRCGEDEWGIWAHGALVPDLSARAIRKLMASPPSGDWRRKPRGMELVAVLSVNVPGFPVKRGIAAKVYEQSGMVASLVYAQYIEPRIVVDDAIAARAIHHIAASLGLTTQQRLSALRQRVLGGR